MLKYTTLERVKINITTARSDRVRFSDCRSVVSIDFTKDKRALIGDASVSYRDFVFSSDFERELFLKIEIG